MSAYIYCRLSNANKKNPFPPPSLKNQINTCEMYCFKNNLNIIDIFDQIKTARNGKNKYQLLYILEQMNEKDILIIPNVSRFSRNFTIGLKMLNKFAKKNIDVYSVEEKISFKKNKSKFLKLLHEAEFESNKCSDRMKRSIKYKKNAGGYIFGKQKFGLMTIVSGNKRHIVPNEEEQHIIKLINKYKYSKYNYEQISEKLNNDNFLNKNKKWTKTAVKHVYLANLRQTKNNKSKQLTNKSTKSLSCP